MGKDTNIEWTDHSWNPWWGCTKISAGCTHCYADTLATRYGHAVWGPKAPRRRMSEDYWKQPLKWNRKAEAEGVRKRVFCASMADVFERHIVHDVDIEMDVARARLWNLIEATPMLDWLLLTKRPENICEMVPQRWLHEPLLNVWYGTSTENQEQADARIPHLLRVPAAVRFLSAEPLLGPIDLTRVGLYTTTIDQHALDRLTGGLWQNHLNHQTWQRYAQTERIHWVIAGGESGSGARPCLPGWVRSLRDQCNASGVAFFHKQWGEYAPTDTAHWPEGPPHFGMPIGNGSDDPDGRTVMAMPDGTVTGTDWNGGAGPHLTHAIPLARVGKKKAGRMLDGREWSEFPEVQR